MLAGLPTLIQGAWALMDARVRWAAADRAARPASMPRHEQPDTLPRLQAKLAALHAGVAAWRRGWLAASPDVAPRVLAWVFAHAADDAYRPGLFGVQGPDLFATSLAGVGTGSDPLAACLPPSASPEAIAAIAAHMQDAALYTTALIWAERLDKYLARAASAPTCVDFISSPFGPAACRCRDPRQCATVPPHGVVRGGRRHANWPMAWNGATCAVAGAPVLCTASPVTPPSATTTTSHPFTSAPVSAASSSSSSSSPSLPPEVLIPADIRFVAHMRILAWLCARLPDTRGPVLATLAAVGLAHCAHDVRPAEGNADIASVAVARVFDSTGMDGATDVLLRRYSHAVAEAP